jgi:glutathione synthase/RimK-type ligase-like ATP-grasp enzyme
MASEIDGVIDVVRNHGLTVERINLCEYPENLCTSWSTSADGRNQPFYGAKAGWFHDPGNYSITAHMGGHGREIALRECSAFWEGAALGASIAWLNNPDRLILSSLKLAQLAAAKALGISMPATLVSNDHRAVSSFFRDNDGAVAKSLATGYSVYGTEKLKLYSRRYHRPPEALLSGLSLSPMIFQQFVPKVRELRVTIVDGMCFGMSADTRDLNGAEIDLRQLDYTQERHRFAGIVVPDKVAEASLALMRHFNLCYAGFDWVEDDRGNWLFLELNCMGSFKWSELCGAGDISGALAAALIKRARENE